jgi:hypothetical protein
MSRRRHILYENKLLHKLHFIHSVEKSNLVIRFSSNFNLVYAFLILTIMSSTIHFFFFILKIGSINLPVYLINGTTHLSNQLE